MPSARCAVHHLCDRLNRPHLLLYAMYKQSNIVRNSGCAEIRKNSEFWFHEYFKLQSFFVAVTVLLLLVFHTIAQIIFRSHTKYRKCCTYLCMYVQITNCLFLDIRNESVELWCGISILTPADFNFLAF